MFMALSYRGLLIDLSHKGDFKTAWQSLPVLGFKVAQCF